MTEELSQRLAEVAAAPLLLVASDFDGTLAPIVSEPEQAEADRHAMAALRALSELPQTHAAIISGRALRDLAGRTQLAPKLHLVGSHGSEFEVGFAEPLPADSRRLLDDLVAEVSALSARTTGSLVEVKPASLAFHYRNSEPRAAEKALAEVEQIVRAHSGVHVRRGKMVVELSVVDTNKGHALARLRQRLGATAVLFLGDDVTDEDAFATLSGPDVGVKIGAGETRAKYRVEDTVEAARLLALLAERRAEWMAGSQAVPIERHTMLSDQRSIGLVNPEGRLVWMCLPRIDSSAAFAELLGGPGAGHFDVQPLEKRGPATQQYVGNTFVLQTRWDGLMVTDYLECGGVRAWQRAGRTDVVRVIEGTGRVRVVFAPRLDFGRMETRLRVVDQGVEVEGSLDSLVLRAPGVSWQIVEEGKHHSAVAEVDVSGEPIVLEMRYGTGNLEPDPVPEAKRRERTQRFWSDWAASLTLPRIAPDLVRRSALVIKALCYGPTGAIAAAATTSLPEHAGGVRNWDYRFCWPRDAALAATALVELGATGPAVRLLDWLLGIVDQAEPGSILAPVYTVTGAHLGPEGEIAELSGYRGSRPVRVGNLAARQVQLDVFGPIAELLARLAAHGVALSAEHWRLLERMVTSVADHWAEPDHGIWEVRRPRQHHVHSKVMCWQTVDRAIRIGRYLGRKKPEWTELRDRIAADVVERGWNAAIGAFSGTYDTAEPDASALAVVLSGLLRPDDPKGLGTIQFVERELRSGPAVYRYRYDDGLPGVEGGFLLCTGWLIEAYARCGAREAAERLFDEFLKLAGPTGLLAEEFDPVSRLALGNFPQAYSHLALINAAVALSAVPAER